jgi:hypothetical protein
MSDPTYARVLVLYRTVDAECQRLLDAESKRRTALRRERDRSYGAARERIAEQIEHSNGVADGLLAALAVLGQVAFPKPPTG